MKVKICNVLVAALFWLMALTPFYLVGHAIFVNHDSRIINLTQFLFKFFGLWGIFFLIAIPLMTIINNRRTYSFYHGHFTFNPHRLHRRKRWLHQYYFIKFGRYLHRIGNYRIAKDNNIPVDFIMRSYRKHLRFIKQHHHWRDHDHVLNSLGSQTEPLSKPLREYHHHLLLKHAIEFHHELGLLSSFKHYLPTQNQVALNRRLNRHLRLFKRIKIKRMDVRKKRENKNA